MKASKAAITEAAGSNAVTAATLGETAGQAVTDAATSNFSGDAIGSLVESSGLNANDLQEALGSGLTSQADLVAQASAANPNFIAPGMQGFRDRLGAIGKGAFSGDTMSALTNPSGYLPIALGEGQKGVMESQENFERQMAQMELDRKNAREKMYADNPENIPMSSRYYGASGGIMSLAEGGKTLPKAPKKKNPRDDELRFPPPLRLPPRPVVDNSFEAAMSGSQDYRYKPKQSTQPVREAYQKMQVNELTGEEMPTGQYVPPSDYKAGVDAEFNYFPNSNRPATYLGNYLGGTGYDYSGIISGLSNLNGLNNLQGITLPSGLGFNYNNQIVEPTGNDYPAEYIAALIGPGNNIDNNYLDMGDMRDFGNTINYDSPITNMPMDRPRPINIPINEPPMDITPPLNFPINKPRPIDRPISTPPIMTQPMPVAPPAMQQPMPPPPIAPQPLFEQGVPEPKINPFTGQPVVFDPSAPSAFQTPPPLAPPMAPPMPLTLRNDLGLASIQQPQELNISRERMPMFMAEGKQLPNEGLEALNKKAPEVVTAMGFQEGGLTPTNEEVQQVAQAIMGQSPNQDAVINMFIEKYGNEIFMQVREMILNPQGNAQTQGMIEGQGSGMDDEVMGMIGNQRPVAVSPGEYIIPADVVSGLGDGSSDSGAEELDGMLDRVRKERTGTTKQAPQLANAGGLLPR